MAAPQMLQTRTLVRPASSKTAREQSRHPIQPGSAARRPESTTISATCLAPDNLQMPDSGVFLPPSNPGRQPVVRLETGTSRRPRLCFPPAFGGGPHLSGAIYALSTPDQQDQAQAGHRIPRPHEDQERAEAHEPEAPRRPQPERRGQVVGRPLSTPSREFDSRLFLFWATAGANESDRAPG